MSWAERIDWSLTLARGELGSMDDLGQNPLPEEMGVGVITEDDISSFWEEV